MKQRGRVEPTGRPAERSSCRTTGQWGSGGYRVAIEERGLPMELGLTGSIATGLCLCHALSLPLFSERGLPLWRRPPGFIPPRIETHWPPWTQGPGEPGGQADPSAGKPVRVMDSDSPPPVRVTPAPSASHARHTPSSGGREGCGDDDLVDSTSTTV